MLEEEKKTYLIPINGPPIDALKMGWRQNIHYV